MSNLKGGRPPINQAEKRLSRSIRFTESEVDFIAIKAKDAGINFSDFVRASALNKRVKAATPKVDLDTYQELARIGLNLNQAIVKMHKTGQIEMVEIKELRDLLLSVQRGVSRDR